MGIMTSTKHQNTPKLIDRLQNVPLDADGRTDGDSLLEQFLDFTSELGITLYPAQEEALLELMGNKHVILSTPTGSGKSLVALFAHFMALSQEGVSFYTAPTKALVNEKFFSLCDAFLPENVGLLTGDATVNSDAPIICCTAEILANMALRDDDLDASCVIMDEFHFYGDRDRGAAWQLPLITLKNTIFLLMSATLGDVSNISTRIESFSGRQVSVVRADTRPVPLSFEYRESILHETVQDLLEQNAAPVYVVSFTQRETAEVAQSLLSIDVCTKEEKKQIAHEVQGSKFDTPFGKQVRKLLLHGIGIHHAGLLPRYRLLVERLCQTGLIKIISGTDTLGVGVNIPIRTVCIRRLYKYDGEKNSRLSARDFHQIAGRAGRKGFDDHGLVVVLAPEWVAENRRIKEKIAANPHLKKKLVMKKPPQGAIGWDKNTFVKLRTSLPEPIEPKFQVTHGMLINLLQGADEIEGGNGYARLVEIISRIHAPEREKKYQRRKAAMLFRSLLTANIIKLIPKPTGTGTMVQMRSNLQIDFSLNHALSLYLVEAISHLDKEAETYALDILSLVESVLENPRVILRAQVHKLKGQLVAKLKAEGVEYEERMAQLDQVDYPKPLADFIYTTFDAYSKFHPWVGDENIRPKSIVRQMIEEYMGFVDYIKEYGLQRSEGVVLRYISQAYKTAVQSVPEDLWTEEFEDILAYLYGMIRRTDSSLIEAWELMVSGPTETKNDLSKDEPAKIPDLTSNPRAFAARIRNEFHMLQKALAEQDYERASELVRQTDYNRWPPERFQKALSEFFEAYKAMDTSPRARQPRRTTITEIKPGTWTAVHRIAPERKEPNLVEQLEYDYSSREQRIEQEEKDWWMLQAIVERSVVIDDSGPLLELERIGQ